MLHPVNSILRRCHAVAVQVLAYLVFAWHAMWRFRRTAWLALAFLVLAGSGLGFYAYAVGQWHVAQAAVKEDRLEEARSALDLCLFVWPRSVQVHLLAARVARLKGDFKGAELHLNQCMRLQHGATEAIQVEFLLMRVQGGEEDEVAPELMAQYVDVGSPESPLILETLARAYMHNHRYAPAYDCLSRWIEVAPDAAKAYQWRGWVLERVNDHEGAMKEYQRALELDPDLIPARLWLAERFLYMSNTPEALRHLELLHQKAPERRDVMALLGQCRFAQGESEEARRLLEAAVEEMPKDAGVLVTLAKLELQEKHAAKAEEWVRRALKETPTDTEAEFTLAAALQAQERWDEAKTVLEQHGRDTAMWKRIALMLQQDAERPNTDPAALSELGVIFLHSNEHIGLYWLHRALQRDPRHQPTHKALAEYFESKGDREKAAFHRLQLKPESKTPP